jgi:hypothetical protein
MLAFLFLSEDKLYKINRMFVIDKVYQKECFENVSNNHWVPPSNGADAFGVGAGVVEPLIRTYLSSSITSVDENAAGKEHTCVSF